MKSFKRYCSTTSGISTSIGVSTSKNPLSFIKFLTDETIFDLLIAIFDSSLEIKSKYLCLYLISLSFATFVWQWTNRFVSNTIS